MSLNDEKLRQLIELAWDVATESTFKARMALIMERFRALIPYDSVTATLMDSTPPGASPSPAELLSRPAALVEFDVARHFYCENYSLELAADYMARYVAHDVVARRAVARPGTPYQLSRLVPAERWGQDPFTGEFLPRVGWRYGVGVAIPVHDGLAVGFGPWRSARRKDFTRAEVRLMKLFLPIVSRAALAALLTEKLAKPSDPGGPPPRNGFALFGRDGSLVNADDGARHFLGRLAEVPHGVDKVSVDVLTVGRTGAPGDFVDRTFLLGDGTPLRVSVTRVGPDGGSVAVLFTERSLGPDAALGAAAVRLGLTPREAQVGRLVIDGKSNKEIAVALRLSQDTVKSHLKSLFRKAGVTGRTELAMLLSGAGRPADAPR